MQHKAYSKILNTALQDATTSTASIFFFVPYSVIEPCEANAIRLHQHEKLGASSV